MLLTKQLKMNLLLQAIHFKMLSEKMFTTSFAPLRSINLVLVLAAFFTLNTSSLSALESRANYDICDDVTDGGTIAADQIGCGDPLYDPDIIISTSPATGGSGALEYLWMMTTDDPNGTSSIWNIISGANGLNFDPGPISQTTSYRRCARSCLLYTSPSPRDATLSRMPSSA